MGDLLHRVRRAGLLAVAKGGVGDEAGISGTGSDDGAVESYAPYLGEGEKFAVELGFGPLFQTKAALRTFLEKNHCTSEFGLKLAGPFDRG